MALGSKVAPQALSCRIGKYKIPVMALGSKVAPQALS